MPDLTLTMMRFCRALEVNAFPELPWLVLGVAPFFIKVSVDTEEVMCGSLPEVPFTSVVILPASMQALVDRYTIVEVPGSRVTSVRSNETLQPEGGCVNVRVIVSMVSPLFRTVMGNTAFSHFKISFVWEGGERSMAMTISLLTTV